MFSSIQLLSHVWLFATPWTAACQASLSITNSRSLLKLMPIESVMPSNHLILCHPFSPCLQYFPASGPFPMSQFFTSGGQSTGASASVSVLTMNIYWILRSTDLEDQLEKTLESLLDCKEVKPVHPKGNQSWIFSGRTGAEAEAPILWPPDAKSQLFGKDPDAGKD